MSCVAVGADGRSGITCPHRLSMNTREKVLLRPCMTGAARRGDIRPIYPALGILVAKDFVSPVATGTRRSYQEPVLGQCETMNGVHVHGIDIRQAKLLC